MTCKAMTQRLTELNREWSVLAPHALPDAWRSQPALAGTLRLGDLERAVGADPDAVLLALLELQSRGDALAGRAVLQLMLGKIVRMASRDRSDGIDEYLAAAWERIATYPVERRRQRVAANLVLDTLKTVVARREPRAPVAADVLAAEPTPSSAVEARAVIDEGLARGLIDARTARTLTAVYVEGRTSKVAAAHLGTSADAVRWRCSKGVRSLRAAAGELAGALAG